MRPKGCEDKMVDIRIVKAENPNVAPLIELHLSGMISNSPADSVYALDSSGLTAPDVTLFGAFENNHCVSIGAVKTLSSTHGEIKSMRTHPDALGHGYGKAILKHIIEVAKQRGWTRLSLETGTGPSFDASHHIYQTHDFEPSGPFSDYKSSDFNRFFSLKL